MAGSYRLSQEDPQLRISAKFPTTQTFDFYYRALKFATCGPAKETTDAILILSPPSARYKSSCQWTLGTTNRVSRHLHPE